MTGKIIRGLAGFYYVHVENVGILECKAKGIFRKKSMKPLVGDNVTVDLLDEDNMLGSITEILPRKNSLIRPEVANVDQAMVIFAATVPKPNFNLLDRFMLMMKDKEVPVIICINKTDTAPEEILDEIAMNYQNSGCSMLLTSTVTGDGMEELKKAITGKTTVFAGPSGVGKSSVMNKVFPEASMEIGEISEKIKRGKHTTRHSEIFSLGDSTYLVDTPGFTSLEIPDIEKEDLRYYYKEFEPYEGTCKFLSCVHLHEPSCGVKEALEQGAISKIRYQNYLQIYEEIGQRKRY